MSDAPSPGQNIVCGDTCEVWFAELGQWLQAIEAEERRCPRLSADELVRAERMSDPDRRRLWRASHIALREILERCAGQALPRVPFVSKADGRPELAPDVVSTFEAEALSFSLSHTSDVALIAVSRMGPVGVDIEAVHARAFSEARRNKIEAIAVSIASGSPLPAEGDRRFLQAWTRVEALSKADGRGVLYTLNSSIAQGPGDQAASPLKYEVRDLDVGAGYCAAVAGARLPTVLTVKRYIPAQLQGL